MHLNTLLISLRLIRFRRKGTTPRISLYLAVGIVLELVVKGYILFWLMRGITAENGCDASSASLGLYYHTVTDA